MVQKRIFLKGGKMSIWYHSAKFVIVLYCKNMWVKFLSIVFYNAKRTQNSQLWYETATFEAQALSFKKPFKIFPKATARCDTNCNEDLRSARRKPTQTRLRATAARAPEHGVTPTVMRTFVLL